MYDYGARFYDPAVGRWFTPDAMAEKYYDQSIYTYTLNNPILFVDPDGNQVAMCCEDLLNWANEYRKGAWEAGMNMITGVATSTYNNISNGVNAVNKVVDAYQEGGVNAAAGEYVNQVYETSGAKSTVETVSTAAQGDPKAIGKTAVIVTALVMTRQVGKSKLSTTSTGSKVDLMGGKNGTKGYTNFDKVAETGIVDDVANFGEHFGKGAVYEVVVSNLQASFLKEVTNSMQSGGKIIVRGTMSNKFFNKIFNGKADGLNGYNVKSKTINVENKGYTRTDVKPVTGQINEIILERN